MERPRIGLSGTDEQAFDEYVERLMNPLKINTGIFDDSRVKSGLLSSADSFMQNIKAYKNENVRGYFFKKPEKLNKVLQSIKPKQRIDLCKIMWKLIDADLRVNLQNFGVPASKRKLGRALRHNNKSINGPEIKLDQLHLDAIMSVLTELPLAFHSEGPASLIKLQENLNEYYFLGTRNISVNELNPLFVESLEKAKETLHKNPDCKRFINVFILRGEDIYLNLHIFRGYYEMRFSIPTAGLRILSDTITKSLMPSFYYYAPSILTNGRTKICIVGSVGSNAALEKYKVEIEQLTSVFSFSDK